MEFKSERIGYRFPCEVIFGRTQAAHEDDDLGTRYRKTGGFGQALTAIANDGFENHLDTKLVKLFGQIKRVRVLTERS